MIRVLTIFDFFAGYLRLTTAMIEEVWRFVLLFFVIMLMFANIMYIFYAKLIETEHFSDNETLFQQQIKELIKTVMSNYMIAIGELDRDALNLDKT